MRLSGTERKFPDDFQAHFLFRDFDVQLALGIFLNYLIVEKNRFTKTLLKGSLRIFPHKFFQRSCRSQAKRARIHLIHCFICVHLRVSAANFKWF